MSVIGEVMDEEYLKFVIVGHVDHGKSTLIGRLLYDTDSLAEGKIEEIKEICNRLGKDLEFGYIMDHLEEERDQGITIDTTQIFFKTEKSNYVIIDAPGHVEFLRNMITGASQAEAAVLIVDAKEGVRDQTKRHAYILSMLGLDQIIVVINKMDLVSYDEERFKVVKAEILNFLGEIGLNPTYVVPISASKGDNVARHTGCTGWYSGPTVLQALDTFCPKESSRRKPLRFVVQDVYNINKRIVVGRVESGIMRAGDRIKVLPSDEETGIETLEEFLADPKEAEAGKSIGMTTQDKLFIQRGDVITHLDDLPKVTDTLRAHIFWMDKVPLKEGDSLWFRCATQEIACRIDRIHKVINSSTLSIDENVSEAKVREVADVTIRTDKPVVVEEFNKIRELGRFVLGRSDVCASGIISGLVA